MFHADPHAGNLLYDKRTGDLAILDWALTERVSREERRHLAMLFLTAALRDPDGIFREIQALSRGGRKRKGSQAKIVRDCVENFIAQLPLARIPGAGEALGLLENIAIKGVRLPAPLIMLRKVLFTLDGVQHDIGDPEVSMVSILARHATQCWLTNWKAFGSPLSLQDWLAVQSSTLFYGSRVCWQGAQGLLDRSLAVLSELELRTREPPNRNSESALSSQLPDTPQTVSSTSFGQARVEEPNLVPAPSRE